ncbi:MAG: hypothetical protein GC137_02665 [Alphaproteobacteria bacterium]|nr:hypothetical protein [Alphaproteobacteria bacterium]
MNKQQLEKLSDEGDLEARFTLAKAYFYGDEGLGIDADPIEAMLWYDMAAQMGHRGAIEALFEHADDAQKRLDSGQQGIPEIVGVAMYVPYAVEYAKDFDFELPDRAAKGLHVQEDVGLDDFTAG